MTDPIDDGLAAPGPDATPDATSGASAAPETAAPERPIKERIVDAFLALLATTPLSEIELTDVARDAGVSLAELRLAFNSRMAILAEYTRQVDAEVLRRDDPAMAHEPARDRLFDVLMRRLDVIAPHRAAVRMLSDTLRRDPMTAAALNPLAVRSMGFMLAAAGIAMGGSAGRLRAQALAVAWAQIVPVWLDDTDPGLARTMVAVDKALSRGEQMEAFRHRLCKSLDKVVGRFGKRRDRHQTVDDAVVAGEGI